MGITAIVEVHLNDERIATVDLAKATFRAAPEVQQCYYVTGGTSFVLIIVSSDMTEYEATTRRLFAQNTAVASFRSLIALDRVKAGSEIEIPDL
jgi:DNA-binding Lrp family transcriptional regulator